MISKIIKCSKCSSSIEVTTWKKFAVCPYCNEKVDFNGFDYKKVDGQSSEMAGVKYEQDCPSCRSKHMFARSFMGKWRCYDCGYMISNFHKLTGVFWFCDSCGTYMNIQPGFTTKKKKWKCTECGFDNSVTKKDIW